MECPYCHQVAPDTNYKCPHCHNVLKENVEFPGINQKPVDAVKKSMGLTYVLAVIILVGAALIGYLFIQSKKKVEKPLQIPDQKEVVYREVSNHAEPAPIKESVGDENELVENESNEPAAQPADDSPEPADEAPGEVYAAAPKITLIPGEEVAIAALAQKGKTTIFDFYSDYCGPCRMMSPRLEQLDRRRDDIVVIKIDINRQGVRGIDWNSPVARQYNLRSIPHFVIYNADGRMTHEGSSAWQQVQQLLYQEGF